MFTTLPKCKAGTKSMMAMLGEAGHNQYKKFIWV